MTTEYAPTKAEIYRRAGSPFYVASVYGKMAPILRLVPGNTSPAHAAEWRTPEEAIAELPKLLGGPIEVVRIDMVRVAK